jgi:uncharacterized damage-inducible protein DinB
MSEPALTATELLAWMEQTSDKWRVLIEAHPEILAMPCDVMGVSTVAELLQHIVAVELRYAERLAGLPATDYATIPFDSVEVIYATHAQAMQLYREQLASDVDWNERIGFATRSMGPANAMRKAVLFHALLHASRHYAQLATLVRQHGVKPDFQMDYLVMDMRLAASS